MGIVCHKRFNQKKKEWCSLSQLWIKWVYSGHLHLQKQDTAWKAKSTPTSWNTNWPGALAYFYFQQGKLFQFHNVSSRTSAQRQFNSPFADRFVEVNIVNIHDFFFYPSMTGIVNLGPWMGFRGLWDKSKNVCVFKCIFPGTEPVVSIRSERGPWPING